MKQEETASDKKDEGQDERKEQDKNNEEKEKGTTTKKVKITPVKKGMNVIPMVTVMNNDELDSSSKERLMEIINTSSKKEEMEISDMAPTGDRKSMLTEYILKAKKNKLEAKKRRNQKFMLCKKRLEGLGIHL
jgi:uncharacterized protein YfkK (UPF0435 family)